MDPWERGLAVVDEVEQLGLERTVHSFKTQEEIERLTVDESLAPVPRALYLLRTGSDIQRCCVLSNLPTLLVEHRKATINEVIPKACLLLPSLSHESHLVAVESIVTVCRKQLVTHAHFTTYFLPTIIQLMDSRESATASLWLQCLLDCMAELPNDVLKREILGMTISKGQLTQPASARAASCRLIGVLASKFDPYWLRKELLSVCRTLCQDVDMDVRRNMALQLNAVARGLGLEGAKGSILPELIELTNDEETSVQLAAVDSIVNLIDFLDGATCSTIVLPLLVNFCDACQQRKDETTMVALSRLVGKMCHLAKEHLADEQKPKLLEFYCWLSSTESQNSGSGNVEDVFELNSSAMVKTSADEEQTLDMASQCRHMCAFNLPAMTVVAGRSLFQDHLLTTVRAFQLDEEPQVRMTLACGLHEVIALVAPSTSQLFSVFIGLLRDTKPQVVHALMSNFSQTVELLMKYGTQEGKSVPADFMAALLNSEAAAAQLRQWRLHADLIRAWSCLPRCLLSEQIYAKFVPVLFRILTTRNRVLPVKMAAAYSLLVFIRNNRRPEQRQEMCDRLLVECGQAESYRQRVLFVDICFLVLEVFSRAFFKEHFFAFALTLAKDPISNVRLTFCKLLPALKAALKLPADRLLWQQMEKAVREMLAGERQASVAAVVRETLAEMDRIEIVVGSALTRGTVFEEDTEDQRKQNEEEMLRLMDEQDVDSSRHVEEESRRKGSDAKKQAKTGRRSSTKSVGGNSGSPTATNSPAQLQRRLSNQSINSGLTRSSSGSLRPSASPVPPRHQLSGSSQPSLRSPSSPAHTRRAVMLAVSAATSMARGGAAEGSGRESVAGKASDSVPGQRQVKLPAISEPSARNKPGRSRSDKSGHNSLQALSSRGKQGASPNLSLPPHVRHTRQSS